MEQLVRWRLRASDAMSQIRHRGQAPPSSAVHVGGVVVATVVFLWLCCSSKVLLPSQCVVYAQQLFVGLTGAAAAVQGSLVNTSKLGFRSKH